MRPSPALHLAAARLLIGGRPGRGSSAVPRSRTTRPILHVLNRLGFGPRPATSTACAQIGLDDTSTSSSIPRRIADAAMAARLAGLETLDEELGEIARGVLPAGA